MLSSSIHYRTTLPQAQRSTAAKQVQQYVPIRVRQRKQADREHLLYCSTASKVHHSSIPQKASKQVQHYVPIRVRPQANRVGESQHMPSSIYTARRVLKRNEEIEVCPAYKIQTYANVHKQLLKLVCDVASRKLLFLSVLSISSVHAAACTGLFSWTMELLAFARRQFSLCTQNHGYPLHSFAFRSLLRVRVRVRVRFNYSV